MSRSSFVSVPTLGANQYMSQQYQIAQQHQGFATDPPINQTWARYLTRGDEVAGTLIYMLEIPANSWIVWWAAHAEGLAATPVTLSAGYAPVGSSPTADPDAFGAAADFVSLPGSGGQSSMAVSPQQPNGFFDNPVYFTITTATAPVTTAESAIDLFVTYATI